MNRLITIAAWACALATVGWQRLLRPALQLAFSNFDELFPAAAAPALVPSCETHESHASLVTPQPAPASRRRGRPKTTAHAATGRA